jgi:hypothetical protein
MIAVKGEGLAREERVMDAIEVAAQTTISTTSNQSLAFSSSTYTTGEGGPAYVKVNRTGGSSGTVSVNYSMANISATAGTDYTATSDILSFASGEVTKLISIPIINDTATESNETFSITLSNPAGGATLGTPATATVTIVDDDTPTASGQWGPVINWPVVPIHIHLLPTGKVMFWDRHTGSSDSMKTWAWDPVTQAVTELASPGYDIFCSGHTFMADGKLIVTGGHHMADNVGENTASVYDPVADSWISLPNMNAGRWYPTNTTLANGDILVMAGTINAFNDVNLIPQVWQTASNSWRYLTGAAFLDHAPAWPDYYPFNYVAPNGKVFNAGPQQTSRYLDTTGTGTWSDVANSSLSYRDYGSSVMYADGKVLIVGGNPRFPTDPNVLPSATAEVIDLNSANPAWRSIAPMSVGRRHLNTTLLPDGKVLVTGGSSFYGHNDPSGKVLYAEMWDPQTEAWAPMAGHRQYRGYHSNALLLPDGRVLIAGGGHPDPPTGAEPNAEIYSPPYIFKGARPVITSAPAQVGYGQTFFVETPGAQNIAKVTWIRLSSVTHAFNENQRINQLSFSQATGGLMVTAPSGANLCPPGDYMLFILNSTGVPSIARIVRIGTSSPNYAGFLEVGDCNTISGWAADRNRLNTSITVSIYDGNTLVTTVTANQSRPDVGNFLGDNGLHGFSIATPASLKNGPHTLRVKFESSATELNNSPKMLNCTLTDYAGYWEVGDCNTISGWAADRNRPNTSINVSIYDGNTLVTSVPANQSRPDVGGFLGDNGLHGFSIATPASLKNGPHTVRVKFESSATELGSSPRTLNCTLTDYTGYWEVGDCNTISGWAADRNRLNTSITVSIYDGNTLVTTVTANQSRPDVGNFLGDNGLHGFSIATPASLKNGQPHTVRVKFESSSTELNNSPKTINCLSSFLRLTTRGDYSALSWLTREPPW